ncbi:hypothetical protein [Aquimarina latercula]|uniref:hypothetical protein n=1 Tax=Aquimarina latercula TaxID=987 RepID=UPI00040C3B3B|nr:hypothetical protein [Aquimarina latercula]
MKLINKFLVLGGLSIGLLFNSCTDDEKLPNPLEASDVETNGAYLKTISSSFVVDLFDIDGSGFEVTLEEHDALNDGSLIQDVDVYVRFTDNTVDEDGTTTPMDPDDDIDNSKDEILYETIPSSAFSMNSNSQPEVTYQTTMPEVLTALGLINDNLDGADNFFVRFTLNLTDGNSYTTTNTGTNIVSQPVFNSPFEYQGSVVCVFDEPAFFTGTYMIETTVNGAFGSVFDETVEITVDENDPTKRRFDGDWNGFGLDRNYSFSLVCGKIIWDAAQSTGLQCPGGPIIALGTATTNTEFDTTFTDDNSFEINMTEDTSSCSGPAAGLVQVRFTRI